MTTYGLPSTITPGQFNLLERKIGYNSRTPMDSPKLRKTMVKEKSTFLSPELKSLVNDAFKKLVAISCERAALTDAHEVYAHELYCPRHGINHPLRPQDRKEIWKEIKNELLKMETAPAIFNFDVRGANILYSKLIERNTHHSPSVESPKPTPPKNISVVLTEEEAKEFWECYRKNAFLNREIALSAVDCAPFPQEGVRPYQCSWCNNWHIGHASWLTNGEASEYYYRNRLSKANRKDLQSLDKYKLFILKRRSQESLKS